MYLQMSTEHYKVKCAHIYFTGLGVLVIQISL